MPEVNVLTAYDPALDFMEFISRKAEGLRPLSLRSQIAVIIASPFSRSSRGAPADAYR